MSKRREWWVMVDAYGDCFGVRKNKLDADNWATHCFGASAVPVIEAPTDGEIEAACTRMVYACGHSAADVMKDLINELLGRKPE